MAHLIGSVTLRLVGERLARPSPTLVCEYVRRNGKDVMLCNESIREGDDFHLVMTKNLAGDFVRSIWCVDHREERED